MSTLMVYMTPLDYDMRPMLDQAFLTSSMVTLLLHEEYRQG